MRLLGVLEKSQADSMPKKENSAAAAPLPEVNFSDFGDVRCLHLGTEWVQGTMRRDAPYDIELEYVQRMMAGLLFTDAAAVAGMHAMQLGLGSAALTKFCYKKLRMKTTAVEINPQVVTACRVWFKLPPDGARLQVILADAASEIKKTMHRGTVDLLHVDLYDHEAAAPVLDDAYFYANCRKMLTDTGVMTVNLFGRDSSYEASLVKMAEAFGPESIWAFTPTREGNTVVLAQFEPTRPDHAELLRRASVIESRYDLPAKKWLKLFKPVL